MSRTPFPKAAKLAWAKQLTRSPCLVIYVKFLFLYINKRLTVKPAQLVLNFDHTNTPAVNPLTSLIKKIHISSR